MNKAAIKAFAVGARKKLITSVTRRAASMLDGTDELCRALALDAADKGFDAVVEETAYTWFQRMIGMRYMEVNGYLPSGVRLFSKENSANDSLTELFVTECRVLAALLPDYFGGGCSYLEALLDLSGENNVIQSFVETVPDNLFAMVEIVGWLYQYYNEEHQNEVINLYGGRVKEEDVSTATRFFTTDWIVRSMVDNSLGKYWMQRNPHSTLLHQLDYYLGGTSLLPTETISPLELKLFDPCMGSGHILVYAFDVLLEIYKECGYSPRDAVVCILRENLFGLDIDRNSCRIASFALMMKARRYHPNIFTQDIHLNLYAIEESNGLNEDFLELVAGDDSQMQQELGRLMLSLRDARKFGSAAKVNAIDFPRVYRRLNELEQFFSFPAAQEEARQKLFHLLRQAEVMTGKYEVVATNPPYLNKMDKKLKRYVSDHYRGYCEDLFSVFIYKSFDFCRENGYCAFVSPFVWMFIKAYEQLRKYIILNKSISSLVQLEYSAFEEATVPLCTFVLKNGAESEPGVYLKLSNYKGGMEVQKRKVLEAKNNPDCPYRFEVSANSFTRLPGMPIAYWSNGKFGRIFLDFPRIEESAVVTNGLFTCDNKRFLRRWYEVPEDEIYFDCNSRSSCEKSPSKWYPYNKGGDFRKWYGNHEYVVNFQHFGSEIGAYRAQRNQSACFPGKEYYFLPSISWSLVSSSHFSVRYYPAGFVFDIAGSSIFVKNSDHTYYYLAFLSSIVASEILNFINPTLNYQAGNIAKLPICMDEKKKQRVDELVKKNIALCKSDWDSTELSWNFKMHPLLRLCKVQKCNRLSDAFKKWERLSAQRFHRLKTNEEELNRIFIDIYGLNGVLSAEVKEKDITVRKADLHRDILSFISYAVGCSFGRYSVPGVFVGKKEDILLITETPCLKDDIVACFISFVRDTCGQETLRENLDFIAAVLGGRGTAEQRIRAYFAKQFFADHVKAYRKRPIYWLLDGGSAKVLFYLHSYHENTFSNAHEKLCEAQQKLAQSRESSEFTKKNKQQLEKLTEYNRFLKKTADRHIRLDLNDGVQINYSKVQGGEKLLPVL